MYPAPLAGGGRAAFWRFTTWTNERRSWCGIAAAARKVHPEGPGAALPKPALPHGEMHNGCKSWRHMPKLHAGQSACSGASSIPIFNLTSLLVQSLSRKSPWAEIRATHEL